MEHVDKNGLASHESLSENIDDVVDDLFSELAEQIETTDEISGDYGDVGDSNDNELTFSDEIGWGGMSEVTGDELSFSDDVKNESIPEEFINVVRRNINSLTHCAARLTQLERLFTEAPGYGKLYGAIRNIRETTEYQMDSLTRALLNDYRKLQAPPMMPIRRWKMRKKTAHSSACPWSVLTLAKWKDTMVAFVPEQIAYLSTEPIITSKKNSILFDFPLKNLKKWPWEKLQPLFSGILGELSEQQLSQLKLPIIQHPGIFQTLNESKGNLYLLILNHENNAGAVFLDSYTEDIFIPSRWAWSREAREDTVLAGHIKVYGKYLPVINIAKQDSLSINFE
jgi:hypothetical protein